MIKQYTVLIIWQLPVFPTGILSFLLLSLYDYYEQVRNLL